MTEFNKDGFMGQLGVQDMEGIFNLIKSTCELAGMSELYKSITWKFNTRLTTTLGRAWYEDNLVEFCFKLWSHANFEQRRDVIIHETVHILCYLKYGENCGHNYLWKAMMIKCGGSTERCHTVNTNKVARKIKKYDVSCRCRTHVITSNRLTRMKNGSYVYRCQTCKYLIDPDTAVLKEWWMHE